MIWAARLVGLALAAFLGLMALDTPIGLGLLIHLIPCFIVLILVAIGWRWSRLGGWLFLGGGRGGHVVFQHLPPFAELSDNQRPVFPHRPAAAFAPPPLVKSVEP